MTDAQREELLTLAKLVTTNIPAKLWPAKFDARVASRLSAARTFDTTGIPDYRPVKAKGNQ